MRAQMLPPPLRDLIIKKGFERRGPWLTGFDIAGKRYGGDLDYRDDRRLSLFFEEFADARRVLELGSFEGGHSFLLADRVDEVVGVEVRSDSIRRAEYVRKLLGIRNVRFIQADLEQLSPGVFGRFDAVFCSGLVYHLPRPWELLGKLAEAAPRAWIWTHYATESMTTHDGWEGRWHAEGGMADPLSGVSPRSFWLTTDELRRALREGGYDEVRIVAYDRNENGEAALLTAATRTGGRPLRLPEASPPAVARPERDATAVTADPDIRVWFVKASEQNVFFDELSAAFQEALRALGLRSETAVDHFPALSDDAVYVVVPHEYFPLTLPRGHPSEAQLRRTVALTTEQPGTAWFEEGAQVAAKAGAVVDINALGIAELKRRGIKARLLRLGYVEDWDHWHRAKSSRPIDATFLGGYTRRRGLALARCGTVLQGRRAAIHLVETARPHKTADRFFLSGERKFKHLASSKVLLNAHREANTYLEWPRLLEATANGCVVLTEHSSAFAPLVAGEHFVSVGFDNLPRALFALLDDQARLAEIRDSAYTFLANEFPLSKTISVLAEAVDDVRRRPVVADRASVRSRPAPKTPPGPTFEWQRPLEEPGESDLIRRGIKQLFLAQRRLERRLAGLERADEGALDVHLLSGYAQATPRITVVVALYNYAATIREALRSVGLSHATDDVEVVLVDDASTDDSLMVALETLGELGWLPAKVLSRSHNAGLPAARNLAISHARGEYVFVLDADNAVYPHGLRRLLDALDEDPEAAFAYGILEKFDSTGPIDLVSWLPWLPERLRYGNYIDAMAMVRRAALARVGGFTTDDRLYGWEDFALWCAFAQVGMKGVHVPEIIGRYRSSRHSMISSTNLDTSEAWAILLERYPFLLDDDRAPASHEPVRAGR
jgi:SAM-dependent methyltransferase